MLRFVQLFRSCNEVASHYSQSLAITLVPSMLMEWGSQMLSNVLSICLFDPRRPWVR